MKQNFSKRAAAFVFALGIVAASYSSTLLPIEISATENVTEINTQNDAETEEPTTEEPAAENTEPSDAEDVSSTETTVETTVAEQTTTVESVTESDVTSNSETENAIEVTEPEVSQNEVIVNIDESYVNKVKELVEKYNIRKLEIRDKDDSIIECNNGTYEIEKGSYVKFYMSFPEKIKSFKIHDEELERKEDYYIYYITDKDAADEFITCEYYDIRSMIRVAFNGENRSYDGKTFYGNIQGFYYDLAIGEKLTSNSAAITENTPDGYVFEGFKVDGSEELNKEYTIDKNVKDVSLVFSRESYYLSGKINPLGSGKIEVGDTKTELDGSGVGMLTFKIKENNKLQVTLTSFDNNVVSSVRCMCGLKEIASIKNIFKSEYVFEFEYDDTLADDYRIIAEFTEDKNGPEINNIQFNLDEKIPGYYNHISNVFYTVSDIGKFSIDSDVKDDISGVDHVEAKIIDKANDKEQIIYSSTDKLEFDDVELKSNYIIRITAVDKKGNSSYKDINLVLEDPIITYFDIDSDKVNKYDGEKENYYVKVTSENIPVEISVNSNNDFNFFDKTNAIGANLTLVNVNDPSDKITFETDVEKARYWTDVANLKFEFNKGTSKINGKYKANLTLKCVSGYEFDVKFENDSNYFVIFDSEVVNAEDVNTSYEIDEAVNKYINNENIYIGKNIKDSNNYFGFNISGLNKEHSGVKRVYLKVIKNVSAQTYDLKAENGVYYMPKDVYNKFINDMNKFFKLIAIGYEDKCGNIAEYDLIETKHFKFDFEAPEINGIKMRSSGTGYIGKDNKNNKKILYIKSDDVITVKLTLSDSDDGSGMQNVYLEVKNDKKIIMQKDETTDNTWSCQINSEDLPDPNGLNDLTVFISDKVGNVTSQKLSDTITMSSDEEATSQSNSIETGYEIFCDTSMPTVNVSVTGLSGKNSKDKKYDEEVYSKEYNIFSKNSVKIKITANDTGSDIQEKGIKYALYDGSLLAVTNRNELYRKLIWKDYTKEVILSENEKAHFIAKVTDNVGNVTYVNSDGIIVDTSDHSKMIEITGDEKKYNNGNVTLHIDVKDPLVGSGLDKVYYEVLVGGVSTGIKEEWNIDYKNNYEYSNIVRNCNLSKNITINCQEYNINDISVKVTAQDNAGNISVNTSKNFNIDTVAPSVNVNLSGNSDKGHSGFFKESRTVQIFVTERNFDEANVIFKVTKNGSLYTPTLSWSHSGSGDDMVHTASLSLGDDGDYTLDIEYTDLSGNKAPEAHFGNGAADTKFTIDKTQPVIDVNFDNNNALNGSYYKSTRKGTVVVTEHNFDPSRANVSILCNGNAVNSGGAWSSSGDKNTLVFNCGADGEYVVKITDTDKAGNAQAKEFSERFTIDTKKPEIKISGIEAKKAYGKDSKIVPEIQINDDTFDSTEYSYSLKFRNYNSSSDSTLISSKEMTAGGIKISYDELSHVIENDGIYTLTVKSKDKSGNESYEDITFSVNCFGSTFLIRKNSETENLCNGIYTNKSVDVEIVEINVEKPIDQTVSITKDTDIINCNNFEMTDNDGENQWFERVYKINSENFEDDATYNVTITSTDVAGNTVSSVDNMTGTDAGVNFIVDKTVPDIRVNGIESDGVYQEASRVVKIMCADKNCDPESLKLILNGNEIRRTDYRVEDLGAELDITFDISADDPSKKQNFEVGFMDLAGNTASYKISNFVLSAGMLRRFVNNTPLFIGVLSAVLCGGIGTGVLVKVKRKKN